MKIALIYNIVEKTTDGGYMPDDWAIVIKRFVGSYKTLSAGIDHNLFICTSGSALSETSRALLVGLTYETFAYYGKGWDIGAYQHSAHILKNYDLIACLNSQAYIAYAGWLAKIVDAYKDHGYGIYGTSSSFEVAPHVRTSCMVVPPKLILDYPLRVRCRYDACVFEHSPSNFSLWTISKELPVFTVTKSGAYLLKDSRQPENIFRKGTQNDLLIRDRHTLIFDYAEPIERVRLQSLADGEIQAHFEFLGIFDRFLLRHDLRKKLQKIIKYSQLK